MSNLQPLQFWVQKILPLVYDETLSYYELLCKIVDYLNNTISAVNTLSDDTQTEIARIDNSIATLSRRTEEDIVRLRFDIRELRQYVDDYFDNLDIQQTVAAVVDSRIADGTIIQQFAEMGAGFITPQMYGAAGDGVQDDRAAIQSAINAAVSNHVALFCYGIYKISNPDPDTRHAPFFIVGNTTTDTNNIFFDFGGATFVFDSAGNTTGDPMDSWTRDAFMFIRVNNAKLINGYFTTTRDKIYKTMGSSPTTTRYNQFDSNVQCFNFYGCQNVTISNMHFSNMYFDIYADNISRLVSGTDINCYDFNITNIISDNVSTSFDMLNTFRVNISDIDIRMANGLGSHEHGFYLADNTHDFIIANVQFISDGYCGAPFQLWSHLDRDTHTPPAANKYANAKISNCIITSPYLLNAYYATAIIDNVKCNYIAGFNSNGSAAVKNTILCYNNANIIVKNSVFNDTATVLRYKYSSQYEYTANSSALFDNCVFNGTIDHFAVISSTTAENAANLTNNIINVNNCTFNTAGNQIDIYYNPFSTVVCQFAMAYSTVYSSKFIFKNNGTRPITISNCKLIYTGNTATAGVYYNKTSENGSGDLFTFALCDIVGYPNIKINVGDSIGTYTAYGTYLNGVIAT